MSEKPLDVLETLWGVWASPATKLRPGTPDVYVPPVILRSAQVGLDYRSAGGNPTSPAAVLITNQVAPAGEGGECIFRALHLSLSHTAFAFITVQPIIDGTYGIPYNFDDPRSYPTNPGASRDPSILRFSGGATDALHLMAASTDLVVNQQQASLTKPVLRTVTLTVPLSYSFASTAVANGGQTLQTVESRQFPRGTRFAVRVIAGRIGAGYFAVEGMELEYDVVSKNHFDGQRNTETEYASGWPETFPSPPSAS